VSDSVSGFVHDSNSGLVSGCVPLSDSASVFLFLVPISFACFIFRTNTMSLLKVREIEYLHPIKWAERNPAVVAPPIAPDSYNKCT